MRRVFSVALASIALLGVSRAAAQQAKLVVRTEPALAGVQVEIPQLGLARTTDRSGRVAFVVPPALTTVRIRSAGETQERTIPVDQYGATLTVAVQVPPAPEPAPKQKKQPPAEKKTQTAQTKPVRPPGEVPPPQAAALPGTVVVRTRADALVTIDGRVAGSVRPDAPLSAQLEAGFHRIVVAAGNQADTADEEVVAGTTVTYTSGLTPKHDGLTVMAFVAPLVSALLLYAAWRIVGRSTPPPPDDPAMVFDADRVTGRFDRYAVIGIVGRGGMATIYRATDGGTSVALKLMNAELMSDHDLLLKFLREGRIVSKINQRFPDAPVVKVLRYGREDGQPDGRPYIAMEFLEGPNLLEYVRGRGGRLPPDQACAVVRQIGLGLHAAHTCGVLHRDLTPDNIIVVGAAAAPEIRLIDFGVARHEFTSVHTLDGSIFGKPAYMAPEQCRGGAIGHGTDLYSLGIVFYVLLTGRTPFADRNPLAVMRMHEVDPVPPLADGIPGEVAALVYRLLEKDPAKRFPSSWAMIIELDRLAAFA